MASEKPNILQVKNDIIRIAHPNLEGNDQTFLTAAVAAAGVTLTVEDNTGFADNDYVVIGNIGDPTTEIVQVNAAVTRGTSITVTAVVFAHSRNEPVTLIRYNQVNIYGSTSATDSAPTVIGSVSALDVSALYSERVATTTYAYYYSRFYNAETATNSSYSTSVASTGLARTSARKMMDYALQHTNTALASIEGLTRDVMLEWLNDWQDEVSLQKRQWSWLRTNNDTSPIVTVQTQQEYTLPTDIQNNDSNESIRSVRLGTQGPIKYLPPEDLDYEMRAASKTYVNVAVATTDTTLTLDSSEDFGSSGSVTIEGDSIAYTSKTDSTNVLAGVTGIDATHAVDKEVWQDHTAGLPLYYTIRNSKLFIWPLPDSTYDNLNVYIDYYKSITDLTEDASTTVVPFYNSAHFYLMWLIEMKKGDPNGKANEYEARFRQIIAEGLKKETPGKRQLFRPADSNSNISSYYDV